MAGLYLRTRARARREGIRYRRSRARDASAVVPIVVIRSPIPIDRRRKAWGGRRTRPRQCVASTSWSRRRAPSEACCSAARSTCWGGERYATLYQNRVVLRLAPKDAAELIAVGGRPFEPIKGRRARDRVVVPEAIADDAALFRSWVRRAVRRARAGLP